MKRLGMLFGAMVILAPADASALCNPGLAAMAMPCEEQTEDIYLDQARMFCQEYGKSDQHWRDQCEAIEKLVPGAMVQKNKRAEEAKEQRRLDADKAVSQVLSKAKP
jgi:hypothetical protein